MSCPGPIGDDKFFCSLHCIRPLFYIFSVFLQECSVISGFVLFSSSGVHDDTFYTQVKSCTTLFHLLCRVFFWSLSQVKVNNNIILERIRQGVNPAFMLSKEKKKKVLLVVLNFRCRNKYRKLAFLSIND